MINVCSLSLSVSSSLPQEADVDALGKDSVGKDKPPSLSPSLP